MARLNIVSVAFGPPAREAVRRMRASVLEHHPTARVTVIGDKVPLARHIPHTYGGLPAAAARHAKVNLLDLTNAERMIYLDADTIVNAPIDYMHHALDHYDIVLARSAHQAKHAFWHVAQAERQATISEIGYTPLQWQCGVFAVKRTHRIRHFFDVWADEWARWAAQDQAAFTRALHRAPIRIGVLPMCYNQPQGNVIDHQFGRAR